MGQRWCCSYYHTQHQHKSAHRYAWARSQMQRQVLILLHVWVSHQKLVSKHVCVCGHITSFASLTNPSPHTKAICMEISTGRVSKPGLLPSHWELVSSESLCDWLPTAVALLLPRINVPLFHGQWGTVEVRLLDWYQAWTQRPWYCWYKYVS